MKEFGTLQAYSRLSSERTTKLLEEIYTKNNSCTQQDASHNSWIVAIEVIKGGKLLWLSIQQISRVFIEYTAVKFDCWHLLT